MAGTVLRVLMAESSISETGITLRDLCANQGRSLELVFVSNRDSLSQALLQFNPHVAFLSLGLLQPDPLQAVARLHQSVPHIALILFALPAERTCAADCLQSGAMDYMLEGYMDVPTLDRVLHVAIGHAGTGTSPATSPLWRDELTGLPNRSGLLFRAEDYFQKSSFSASYMIFSICLRDRKELELAAGKPYVDKKIQQVARCLVRCVRRSDVVAHFSKGVFVVVVATANDSCIAPIQGRIECSLVGFGKRQTSERPLIFSVRNSSWRGSSPFSFPEILYAHLAPKKHAAPPSLVTSLEILTTTGMSVEK